MIGKRHECAELIRKIITHIQSKHMVEGDRLPSVRQLASMFGVPANVARDALVQAEMMGLVEIRPRSGAYVRSLEQCAASESHQSISNGQKSPDVSDNQFFLLQARELIEVELAGLAAKRRRLEDLPAIRNALIARARAVSAEDLEETLRVELRFHLGIAHIAGNPELTKTLEGYLTRLPIAELAIAPTLEGRKQRQEFHADIFNALVEGDAEKARIAMRAHMHGTYLALKDIVQKVPNFTCEEQKPQVIAALLT